MTDMQRALAMEIAAFAIVAVFLGVGIWAWVHDNPQSGKPSDGLARPLEDYTAKVQRGQSLHEPNRIDDSTEINTEYLTNDPWYRDTLVELLDSLDKKGDVK